MKQGKSTEGSGLSSASHKKYICRGSPAHYSRFIRTLILTNCAVVCLIFYKTVRKVKKVNNFKNRRGLYWRYVPPLHSEVLMVWEWGPSALVIARADTEQQLGWTLKVLFCIQELSPHQCVPLTARGSSSIFLYTRKVKSIPRCHSTSTSCGCSCTWDMLPWESINHNSRNPLHNPELLMDTYCNGSHTAPVGPFDMGHL